MNPNHNDTVIDEVRETRRRISARFGDDPAAIVAYYLELQKQYGDRLVGATKTPQPPDQSAA
jgi:hypothetical protein